MCRDKYRVFSTTLASERLIDIGQTITLISPSTRGNTDSPVSRRLPRSSVRSRNISDLRTRQRVDSSWIVDMENRRIDAEQKLVDAMMIIAEARRDELDVSRRQHSSFTFKIVLFENISFVFTNIVINIWNI